MNGICKNKPILHNTKCTYIVIKGHSDKHVEFA